MKHDDRQLKLEKLKSLKKAMKGVALKRMKLEPKKSAPKENYGEGVSSINPTYPGFKDPFK
jgi:hypothetical protein